MFDFLSEDWFIIAIEILFLIFIAYDIKKYIQTKKREYITNIVMTLGFFIWASIPFYNSYVTWSDDSKATYVTQSLNENNATISQCISSELFKEYNYESFKVLDILKDEDYIEFIKETKEDCLDDSWF